MWSSARRTRRPSWRAPGAASRRNGVPASPPPELPDTTPADAAPPARHPFGMFGVSASCRCCSALCWPRLLRRGPKPPSVLTVRIDDAMPPVDADDVGGRSAAGRGRRVRGVAGRGGRAGWTGHLDARDRSVVPGRGRAGDLVRDVVRGLAGTMRTAIAEPNALTQGSNPRSRRTNPSSVLSLASTAFLNCSSSFSSSSATTSL